MASERVPKDEVQQVRAMTLTRRQIQDLRARNVPESILAKNGIMLGPDSPMRGHRSGPRNELSSRRRPRAVEHEIQSEFFTMVDNPTAQLRHPELALFHAIPNGGHRSHAVAAKLKAEGVKPGVLDTHLPVARGGYHSLWIEFKRPGATTTPEQAHWLSALAREGHRVHLHTDAALAFVDTIAYLELPRTQVAA